jgi:hypothetical protein
MFAFSYDITLILIWKGQVVITATSSAGVLTDKGFRHYARSLGLYVSHAYTPLESLLTRIQR